MTKITKLEPQDKATLTALLKIVPVLTEKDKAYLLGLGEGIAIGARTKQ
jgi:hypothetical protein